MFYNRNWNVSGLSGGCICRIYHKFYLLVGSMSRSCTAMLIIEIILLELIDSLLITLEKVILFSLNQISLSYIPHNPRLDDHRSWTSARTSGWVDASTIAHVLWKQSIIDLVLSSFVSSAVRLAAKLRLYPCWSYVFVRWARIYFVCCAKATFRFSKAHVCSLMLSIWIKLVYVLC